jgi:hypothetical protein
MYESDKGRARERMHGSLGTYTQRENCLTLSVCNYVRVRTHSPCTPTLQPYFSLFLSSLSLYLSPSLNFLYRSSLHCPFFLPTSFPPAPLRRHPTTHSLSLLNLPPHETAVVCPFFYLFIHFSFFSTLYAIHQIFMFCSSTTLFFLCPFFFCNARSLKTTFIFHLNPVKTLSFHLLVSKTGKYLLQLIYILCTEFNGIVHLFITNAGN